jgi:hypothetical protein
MAGKQKEAFVRIPLWFAAEAAKATKTPASLVYIYLVYRAWKARSTTFSLPNGYLRQWGVSREVKRTALRNLEAAGLIVVDRRHGKTPNVTLVAI